MRRTITITLYWLTLVPFVLLVLGRSIPLIISAFSLVVLVQCATARADGWLSGPRFEDALKAAHRRMARGIFATLAIVAMTTILSQWSHAQPSHNLSELSFYVLFVSALYGIFQLWRHEALGDFVLRRLSPHSLHGVL